MKTYWSKLSPVWQHIHLGLAAAVGVLLIPLCMGSKPSEQQYLMAVGAGLAACFGLQLPAPVKPPEG